MDVAELRNALEILAFLAVILGVPIALYQFYREKKRERLDREYGTYNALDDKYIEYVILCLNNPDLDVFDFPKTDRKELSKEQERRELMLFTFLVSLLERAFLMYSDQSTEIRRKQWTGWDDYLRGWFLRDNFRKAWVNIAPQFDTGFVAYGSKILKANRTQSQQSPTSISSDVEGARTNHPGEAP